jgi:CRP/FNR family cyclic AMP-dependent transcriptional regulator
MESIERLLREHPFLKDLTDEQLRFLTSCGANRRYAANEFLLREAEPAAAFFLLRSGRVALEVHLPGKGPVQVESLGEGDVLGWSWLFPPYRWQLDARAVEPVVTLVFAGDCLRTKMEADHDLGYALTKLMLAQLYHRLERVRLQRLDVYRAEP